MSEVLFLTYTATIGSTINVAIAKNSNCKTEIGSNYSSDQRDREAENPKDSPVSVMCWVDVAVVLVSMVCNIRRGCVTH